MRHARSHQPLAKSRLCKERLLRINTSAEPGEISWAGEVRLELGVPGQQGLWGPVQVRKEGWKARLCACWAVSGKCLILKLNWAGPKGSWIPPESWELYVWEQVWAGGWVRAPWPCGSLRENPSVYPTCGWRQSRKLWLTIESKVMSALCFKDLNKYP